MSKPKKIESALLDLMKVEAQLQNHEAQAKGMPVEIISDLAAKQSAAIRVLQSSILAAIRILENGVERDE
jgi:hypothetical protein